MSYDPRIHNRQSIRLKGYDYTQAGAYFVTICVQDGRWLLGEVRQGEMLLNRWGVIVKEEWQRTAVLRPYVRLDTFQIMPNHFHAIVWITAPQDDDADGMTNIIAPHDDAEGVQRAVPLRLHVPPKSLGAIVRGFKSAVTRRINLDRRSPGGRFWQRNYHERIIRNRRHLQNVRRYIHRNPVKWDAEKLQRNLFDKGIHDGK